MQIPKDRQDPRRAGDVKRYHTCHMLQEQSLAHHQWNVARIAMAIAGDYLTLPLVKKCLMHDVGELLSGDLPYPSKSYDADVRKGHRRIETAGWLGMCAAWRLPPPQHLSDEEEVILKLADMIEMWEHALVEMAFGNKHARVIEQRAMDYVRERLRGEDVPDVVRQNAEAYVARRVSYEREMYDNG